MKIKNLIVGAVVVLGVGSFSFATNFTDVSSEHWAYDTINFMKQIKIIKGFSDESFKPDEPVERAQFAAMLTKTLFLEEKEENKVDFEDVEKDFWYEIYANIVGKDMIRDLESKPYYFNSNSPAIREEMAMTVVKVKGLAEEEPDYTVLDKFKDKDDISEDLVEYVAIAVKNGIMNGYKDGTFNPKGTLTRAEMTAVMRNLIENEEDLLALNNYYKLQAIIWTKPAKLLEYIELEAIDESDAIDDNPYFFNSGVEYSEFEEKMSKYVAKECVSRAFPDYKNVDGKLYVHRGEDLEFEHSIARLELISESENETVYKVKTFMTTEVCHHIIEEFLTVVRDENGNIFIKNCGGGCCCCGGC